ncbi:MAG: DUF3592 domain-containing protein [Agarilytica sp.]
MNIPSIFYVLGGIAIFVVIALWVLFGSLNWEETEAEIIRSEVETVKHWRSATEVSDTRFDYQVNIEFRYKVNGKEYIGSKLFATMPNIVQSKNTAEEFVFEYAEGATVIAFYDPDNYTNAALIAGSKLPKSTLVIISVFVFLVFGVLGGVGLLFESVF